jgi:hypothetical protein
MRNYVGILLFTTGPCCCFSCCVYSMSPSYSESFCLPVAEFRGTEVTRQFMPHSSRVEWLAEAKRLQASRGASTHCLVRHQRSHIKCQIQHFRVQKKVVTKRRCCSEACKGQECKWEATRYTRAVIIYPSAQTNGLLSLEFSTHLAHCCDPRRTQRNNLFHTVRPVTHAGSLYAQL